MILPFSIHHDKRYDIFLGSEPRMAAGHLLRLNMSDEYRYIGYRHRHKVAYHAIQAVPVLACAEQLRGQHLIMSEQHERIAECAGEYLRENIPVFVLHE